MHPTTAAYLVSDRHADLAAEAAKQALASELHAAGRPTLAARAQAVVAGLAAKLGTMFHKAPAPAH